MKRILLILCINVEIPHYEPHVLSKHDRTEVVCRLCETRGVLFTKGALVSAEFLAVLRNEWCLNYKYSLIILKLCVITCQLQGIRIIYFRGSYWGKKGK